MSSASVDDPEHFNYTMAIALIVAWSLVYLCMVQGLTSSGKIVYVTALFPYVVLVAFFIRGITLHGKFIVTSFSILNFVEANCVLGNVLFVYLANSNFHLIVLLAGAMNGLSVFFTPRWEILADPVVWLEAGTQIFFSLGLAFGGLIAFASYNPANNNCYRDAIIVSLTNCGTSVFAGTVVFSVIGFKATATHEKCLETRNALLNGPMNISITIPECNLQDELRNVSFVLNVFVLLLCKYRLAPITAQS